MNTKTATQNQRVARGPFGIATVEKSQYEMRVNDNKYGKSVAMLNVVVPILAAGIDIMATIWARVPKSGTDAGKLVIEAGFPRNVNATERFNKERFGAHALAAATSYPGWKKLEAEAISLLSGETVKAEYTGESRLVRTMPAGKRATVATATVESTIPAPADEQPAAS